MNDTSQGGRCCCSTSRTGSAELTARSGDGIGAQVAERGVLGAAARALAGAREHGLLVAYARLAFDDAYATLASRAPRVRAMREAGLGRASRRARRSAMRSLRARASRSSPRWGSIR